MGLFSWMGSKVAATRATAGKLLQLGQASWMSRDARVFADEGYTRNVIAFRCVQIVARNLAVIKIKAFIGDDEIEAHPILELLSRPNPLTGGTAFMEALTSHNRIAGNAYLEAVRDGGGTPRELYIWTPYEMKVVASNASPVPVGYIWECGQNKHAWEVDELTGQSDILHWKTFNPLDAVYGMSPMEPPAYSIDQHNASSEWNQALLQNSAVPDGMLTSKGNIGDAQYEKLVKNLEDVMSGPRNARRPFIVEGGMEWHQLSIGPKDMDWLGGRTANAVDICASYGVPTQMLGIEGSQTFANFGQARLSLQQETVLPLADELISELNNWLVPMYKQAGLRIELDLNSIPALQESRAKTMLDVNALSYMTINEKRAAAGLGALETEGADEVWQPAGNLPLGLDLAELTPEEAAKALEAAGIGPEIAAIMAKRQ